MKKKKMICEFDLMHNYDDTLESHSKKSVKRLFKRCACSSKRISPQFQTNVHPIDGFYFEYTVESSQF